MPTFLRPLLFLSTAAIVCSQPATSAPPPHDPIMLEHFMTTAAPFSRSQVELAQSTTVLSGPALWRKQQATLGDTLAGETGMSATSFGPGASRPIIRGLGGDRIRLLENSVGTIDASSASPDHAVSVEPFLVERVEIVRGPASLLYGSSALGGIVNVITHRIETELPAQRQRGSGEVRFGGAADEFARGGQLDVVALHSPDSALVAHVDGFRRTAGNLAIPGFAESARLRAAEAAEAAERGEAAPSPAQGFLPNSHLAATGAAGGLSWVGRTFHFGASYSGFDSDYGVPGHAHASAGNATPALHEGVRIDLRQRRLDAQGEWRSEAGALTALRFKFGHASYRHVEHEPDGALGTVFANRGYDARLEALHGAAEAPWHGALGFQASRNRLAVTGDEAFLPAAQTRSHAVFAFEEYARAPLTWQFGARAERTTIAADGRSLRRDTEPSASIGAVWELGATHALAFSVAHTGRAPNAQELFAHGPHAGTGSFEIGDASLRAERALGAEISLRRRTGRLTGAVTAFAHRFAGFIFEQPTGFVAVEEDGAWRFVSPADDLADADAPPVYRYAQANAVFHGAEVETVWHLHESSGNQLDLKLAAEFTRARADGGNLPRIPPARATVGIDGMRGRWSAGAEAQFVAAQRRTASGETPGAAYTLASAYVSWTKSIRAIDYRFFLRGTNLADTEARPHTSFVRDLAPLAGRGLTAGVRASF